MSRPALAKRPSRLQGREGRFVRSSPERGKVPNRGRQAVYLPAAMIAPAQ
jgi:hypothetical protein